MLRNTRLVIGLCALAGVSLAGLSAWATGFFSRLAAHVAEVWGQLMASINGLSVDGLLASAGASVGMLVIILVVMAITGN